MISVIVPVYNGESCLEACLQSVLAQSRTDWELILVNDGSTDGTQAVLERFSALDRRIQWISQKNKGVSVARNVGLAAAKGEFCTFVDADDLLVPDFLEAAMDRMGDAQILAFSEACPGDPYWPEGHILVQSRVTLEGDDARLRYLLEEYLPCHLGYNLHGKLFDTAFLREAGVKFPKGISLGEDLAFLMLCLMTAQRVATDSKVVYTYQFREDSLSEREIGTAALKQYDALLSRVAGELPGAFWEEHFPVLYARTMDIQFRQKPAREMAPNLHQLQGCRLWKKTVERSVRDFGQFRRALGWKDGTKLYLKLCMYGTLLGDCPRPYALLGTLMAWIFNVRLDGGNT